MIRRDTTLSDGAPGWLLIMQPDHARVAGRCAEAWGAPPLKRLDPHAELVSAIYRHDDGWAAWERHIQVDSQSGRPRDFTEMILEDALAIWPDSIASAATVGPLAGYVVSTHFTTLLNRFSSRWTNSDDDRHRAQQFLQTQDSLQSEWLSQWTTQDADHHSETRADNALRYLQMFDFISLWLCCQQRTTPETFTPPEGSAVTFTPLTPTEIKVHPWPFFHPYLVLEVPSRQIAARHYSTAADLAAASSQSVGLVWRLTPG